MTESGFFWQDEVQLFFSFLGIFCSESWVLFFCSLVFLSMPSLMLWFKQALEQGGPLMPFLLLAVGFGFLLCFERSLVWGFWLYFDKKLYQASSENHLLKVLEGGKNRASWLQTPLFRLLSQAHENQERQADLGRILAKERPKVRSKIDTLGWLGGILPSVGLLGTVLGMMQTFGELAQETSKQALSLGIGHALWTTQVGLLGALPCLLAHHVFQRLWFRWEEQAESLLGFFPSSKQSKNQEV